MLQDNVEGGRNQSSILSQPAIAASGLGRIEVPILLVLGDLLILQIIVAISVALRMSASPLLPIDMHHSVFRGVQVAALFLPAAYATGGLYPGYGITPVQRLQRRTSFTMLSFSAMILFDYLAQNGQWSRGILVIAGLLAVLVLPIWDELAIHVLIRHRRWGMKVAIFGPAAQRRWVIETLARQPELGWLPSAETDPENPMPAANLAILVADPAQSLPFRGLDHLPFRKVVLIPNLEETQSLWISVRDLSGLVGLEMRRNLLIPSSQFTKRILDLVGVVLLAVPVALLVLCFAALLMAVSPGPFLFTQVRGGRDGRSFRMLKLRTMVPDAERRLETLLTADPAIRGEWERCMKLRRDPRIVPFVGHLMRRFSIDELPQLWNVLRGEMSLIGPRPLPDYHLATLAPEVRQLRSRARPGMSGLWQVSGRNETSLDEQQRLDLYYVRNWSVWLDLHILGRTLVVVLKGRGAR
jgi:exopolysaccharide biosynthesis polyprenyl glycosylphosphotransferase